ncbi:MAG: ArsR/SmtB family transcription factor [Limnochordia bacterium]|jgi:ArsR family transcriptional regulator
MLPECLSVMKAASDGTRLRILKLLQGRELCVCQIMAVLDMSSSTVSTHLATLRQAGLVRDAREGRWVYYSWETQHRNPYAIPLLTLLRSWLENDSQIEADNARLQQITQMPLDELCVERGRVKLTEKEGELL